MSNAAAVREWARNNGYTVAERGRLAPEIHRAYQAVHGAPDDQPLNAAKCTRLLAQPGVYVPGCGRVWTGLNECHCRGCHRHFSNVRNFDGHRPKGACVDPGLIFDRHSQPKFKVRASAWGDLWVGAGERPSDEEATDLLTA